MLVVNAPRAVPSLCVKPPMTDSCMVLCNLAACAGPVPASTECSRCTRRQCNFYSKNDTMEVCGMVECDGATGANVRTCSIPWPSPDCPLTQGMSAQGMTAIPSLCPLLQEMGSKGWHSSLDSEPLRQAMGWVRTNMICRVRAAQFCWMQSTKPRPGVHTQHEPVQDGMASMRVLMESSLRIFAVYILLFIDT